MADHTDVAAAIAAGDYDGHLDDIVLAVVERAREGAVAFYWRLRVDGDEWTQETVTLGELKFAEQHAKVIGSDGRARRATLAEIDPRATAEHAVALLVAHFYKIEGLPLTEAVAKAEGFPATALADMVGEYEVVRPPKDDATSSPSTTT